MNVWLWVLAGIGAYWVIVAYLDRNGYLPDYVGTQGPILTLSTKRGRAFLQWAAGPKRFWRAWSNFGVGIALVLMVGSFVGLLFGAFAALNNPQPTAASEPRNVLVIPGVNDFLPLSMAPEIALGLLVGLVVHEGGHGLLCRVEDIEIDNMGLALLAVIPIGAFVEPEQESQTRASRGGKTRMFAAGVTNNFAITIVVFAILFGPVAGAIAVAPGAGVGNVIPDSAADEAGVDAHDRITAVDGQSVAGNDDLVGVMENASDRTVELELNGKRTTTMDLSVLVWATAENGPPGIESGDVVVAVNGTDVYTTDAFYDAVADRPVVTLTLDDGSNVTVPIGAFGRVSGDGPIADAGAPGGERLTVTRIGDQRIVSTEDLSDTLEDVDPGTTMPVVTYHDGEREVYDVTFGENPRTGGALIGMTLAPGTTGLSVSNSGVRTYPAEGYLRLLGGAGGSDPFGGGPLGSFFGKILVVLFLPLASIGLPQLPYNFAGFTPSVANLYAVQGPLAPLGDGVFVLANSLFWIGWINIQLGFFNCIPAFPLDGGRILRAATEAVVSRLPISSTRELTRMVTTTVGLTMLVSFLMVVFAPQFLAG